MKTIIILSAFSSSMITISAVDHSEMDQEKEPSISHIKNLFTK
ncbi:hypothetical protein [Enterococcus larvae]|nr:hypothetical protein [Enterococcus larvae]